MHTKAKMPVEHPSCDIQLVAGSDILESRDEAWPGDKNTHCVSVPLAFFLSLNQWISLSSPPRAISPQVFKYLPSSSRSDYIPCDTSTGRPNVDTQTPLHTRAHPSLPIRVKSFSVLYSSKHVSFPEIIFFV